jgi:HAD superfamily hydrolase (TIGR01509 family)
MHPYDAILFDFDGVLVDSEPLHFACWNEILSPYGQALEWDTYVRHCIGVSDREMIERFCHLFTPALPFEEIWAQYPRKKEMFRDLLAAAAPFDAGTVALIHSLAALPLAVVSSSARTEVEPALIQSGLRPRFATLVCGWEAPRLKPAPDPYQMAAAQLAARRPLVVEDSEAGVASARAAGFDVLQVAHPAEVAARVRDALR